MNFRFKVFLGILMICLMVVAYAMAQIPHPAGTSTNTGPGGDFFAAASTATIAPSDTASRTYTVPIGTWFILPDASGIIQIQTATSTWANYGAAGATGFLFSDGGAVRILNSSAVATSTNTLIKMK